MNTDLGPDEIRKIVASISYKPNFKIEIVKLSSMEVELDLQMKVQDTYHPTSTTIVHSIHWFHLGYYSHREQFIEFIRYAIRKLELHELDEWFRIDGSLVNDPHAMEKVA